MFTLEDYQRDRKRVENYYTNNAFVDYSELRELKRLDEASRKEKRQREDLKWEEEQVWKKRKGNVSLPKSKEKEEALNIGELIEDFHKGLNIVTRVYDYTLTLYESRKSGKLKYYSSYKVSDEYIKGTEEGNIRLIYYIMLYVYGGVCYMDEVEVKFTNDDTYAKLVSNKYESVNYMGLKRACKEFEEVDYIEF